MPANPVKKPNLVREETECTRDIAYEIADTATSPNCFTSVFAAVSARKSAIPLTPPYRAGPIVPCV
jgi:hypothetical protein